MTAPRPERIDDVLAGDLAPADEQTLRDALQPAERERLRRVEAALALLASHTRAEEGEAPPAHVHRRALDRLHAAGLAASAQDAPDGPRRLGWGRLLVLPLAAAAAAAVILAVASDPAPPAGPSPMQTAWEDLRRTDPSLSLPTSRQLSAMRPLEDTGDATLLAPRRATPHVAPSFRWEPVDDVASWTLTLYRDGEVLDTRVVPQGSGGPVVETPFPFAVPLERGSSYAWSAVPQPAASATATAPVPFTVADQATWDAYSALVGQIDTVVPPELRDLASAYLDLHGGFYGEAEEAARRHVQSHPADAGARELLRHLLRVLGSQREAEFAR